MLLACLRSLARHGPRETPFEVIIVLNAAPPGVAEALRHGVTGVKVLRSPVNLGLAGAGNRGRDVAQGEFLVLLHDDAEIEPGWLEALVETADAHPEAGAVGGKVLFPDGRLQSAGMILWRDATTSPPWIPGPAPAPTAFDRLRAVDYCGTSSLLVRATAWDAAGGLDETFFPAYFVDVDLSMAIRGRGQVVLYDPRSRIRHHQGASGSRRFRRFVTQRNRRAFLEKWKSALEEHFPPEPDSPAALQRAMDRADAFAGQVRRTGPPSGAGPERPRFDPDQQERRHLEMDLALHQDYAAHLAATLDAVESNRWRQLRQRLLGRLRRWRAG